MYTVDARDKLIELDDLPAWTAGAPEPLLLSDERTTVVAYRVAEGEEIAPLTDGAPEDGDVYAVVRFVGVLAHMLGPPNDEALGGHPLASRGLQWYRAYRVENSSWLRELDRRNSVHPRHVPSDPDTRQHYILLFQDTTFECIARRAEPCSRYVRESVVLDRMSELLPTS